MKRNILIFLILYCFAINSVFAQEDFSIKDKKIKFDKERIYFGGNLGSFQFGTITHIDVAPVIGYRFTDKISAGVGFSYQYFNSAEGNYSTNIYGGRLIGNYSINKNIITHLEGEILSLETKYFDLRNQYPNSSRFLYPSVFVGGGYKQSIGEHSYTYIMILWNLLNSSDSPYENPVIRVGFNF